MGGVAEGADDFRLLALRLRNLGETGLRRELNKAISDAAEPLQAQVRAALPDHLPDRYAAVLDEDLQLSLSKRTGIDTPGVRIHAQTRPGRRKLKRLNSGILTHPVFGNREVWRDQTKGVTRGFFDKPLEAGAPQVREAIIGAIHDVAAQVTRKA